MWSSRPRRPQGRQSRHRAAGGVSPRLLYLKMRRERVTGVTSPALPNAARGMHAPDWAADALRSPCSATSPSLPRAPSLAPLGASWDTVLGEVVSPKGTRLRTRPECQLFLQCPVRQDRRDKLQHRRRRGQRECPGSVLAGCGLGTGSWAGGRGRGWSVGALWDTRARSQPSAALFEACCGDHIQPFDDEEDDDIWEDKEAHCAARVTARARCAARPLPRASPRNRGPGVVPRPCSDWSPQVRGPSGFRERPGA